MKSTKFSIIGFVFVGACVAALTGCVVPGPPGYYGRGPSVQVEAGVVLHDDYVYYPGYQVYYSSNRRQYVYQDGRSWVSRPAPPRVSTEVLLSSPSVRLDFHDAPAIHHANVVQTYPKNWTPPGWNHGSKGENKENHDNGKHNGEKGRNQP